MASSSSTDIRDEAACPICREYLTDPVTMDCGHNFCRDCIVKYCDTWEPMQVGDLECPVCKARMQRGSFRPNWQLANIIEKIKLLALNKGLEDLCKRHKEKLHLFCKEDEELVCFFCERSPEHKSHTVVLKEEAAQEYKTLICDRLEHLKKEREKILAYEANIGEESNSLLKLTKTQRQDTLERFKQLHQFLEEQEKHLLNEIEEMEKEITRRRDEHLARLSEELSCLERSIREMEEKSQQPASELLQDVRRTLQRCERRGTSENPLTFPLELKRKVTKFRASNPILYVGMEKIKDALLSGPLQKANVTLDPDTACPNLIVSEDRKSVRNGSKCQVLSKYPERFSNWPSNVTLDPDTAHPELILSEDQKSVRKGSKCQVLSKYPKRFSNRPCVLGCEGFTTGRHFWEVTVGNEGEWTVGVARKSVERKDFFPLSPEEGVWVVGKWRGKYWAYISPHSSFLPLREKPRRIRVTLNYEGGRVSFSDADTGAKLYTFSGTSFSGETLLPFFILRGSESHLRISS